jgi:hypothetical protein
MKFHMESLGRVALVASGLADRCGLCREVAWLGRCRFMPGSRGFRLGREVGVEMRVTLSNSVLACATRPQQGVHLLGSEYQGPQQKHQQKFCAKADRDFILYRGR